MAYVEETEKIRNLLSGFIESGKIDVSQLDNLNTIINQSNSDQIKVLNNASLSPDEQIILFGALRNISQTSIVMKEKLNIAYAIGENPTTAELAYEIIPILDTLSSYVDNFFKNREILNIEKLESFSRNLYKQSKKLGFSKDVSIQLEEEGIYEPQVEGFIETFNENIINELNLEDELGTEDESIN